MPLRVGNALDLDEHEFITHREATARFTELVGLASIYAWRPALRLPVWTRTHTVTAAGVLATIGSAGSADRLVAEYSSSRPAASA
jgi:hypothetical protein